MSNVINLEEYKKQREELEYEGLKQLVSDLVKDMNYDEIEVKPYYTNVTYGIDTPEVNLNTALQLLVDAQLMLDKIGKYREADRIGDVVGELFGE